MIINLVDKDSFPLKYLKKYKIKKDNKVFFYYAIKTTNGMGFASLTHNASFSYSKHFLKKTGVYYYDFGGSQMSDQEIIDYVDDLMENYVC